LLRVQCKWARRHDDVIVVPCYRNRRNRDGLLRQFYSPDEIDAYAAYCADAGKWYFLPMEEFSNRIAIQLSARTGAQQPEPENQLGQGLRIRR